jgi:perosamine synthetase
MAYRKDLADNILAAIRSVVGDQPVALHEPTFKGNEWKYVKDCLDSTYVSSVGAYVDRFESDLASFTGARYAVAVVNGTAALHVALILAGVKSGDEVLVPAMTFVATTNAVIYCNATPHFVDCEENTLGMDAAKLRSYLEKTAEKKGEHCVNRVTGRVIRAIVPMHTFGHPVDIESVMAVARDFNLVVVEDAAESLGSSYNGKHTGTFGLMGVLSFNGNKVITTGGGGAILTDDASIAKQAKHLTTTAKIPGSWEFTHDLSGFNYRLPNLNAALGCAQLEELPDLLSRKRALYARYESAFADVEGVSLVKEPESCTSNYWLQTLRLDVENASQRDSILEATNASDVMTRPVWRLMNKLVPFAGCPQMDLSMAESLSARLINIPSSAHLGVATQ